MLAGLIDALAEVDFIEKIVLAVGSNDCVPSKLTRRRKILLKMLPASFIRSEKDLTELSQQGGDLFISPYPKLPLFGLHCKSIHMIHDVLDLTHPAYKGRIRVPFDRFRLKKALKKADLSWYVSQWTLKETKRHFGFTGENPKVRPNGIDDVFTPLKLAGEKSILKAHRLRPGYILAIGNGLPHKNLGLLLDVSRHGKREILFVGASKRRQHYWETRHAAARGHWIPHLDENELPGIIKGAFCLAQPSTEEGYGYPPLEAVACGVPAVVSDIPVLRETTGGNALYANPENPKSWIKAFETLEDVELRKNLVDKGLKWVEPLKGRRGWRKHIADIEELLS